MKRSRIDVQAMREFARGRMSVKPLALAVAAATLMACSSREPAVIYQSVEQCIADNPEMELDCRTAYRQAAENASDSAPKYQSLEDCRAEFGPENCVAHTGPQGQSWFMPAMAGFMLARALDNDRYYRSAPLFTSYNRYSPAYGKWTTADGRTYGRLGTRTVRVNDDAFKPKPAVTRTISRGGFGSTVAAKSNWGGSRSSGWGG